MLTKQRIHNAYQNSGLDSYPDHNWMKLNEHERWVEIEELIKTLYIKYIEFPGLTLSPSLEGLYQIWLQQPDAFGKLSRELNLYPIKTASSFDNKLTFLSEQDRIKEKVRQAAETLACYIKNFGSLDQSCIKYWPSAQIIMDRYQYEYSEMNEWLKWYGQLPNRSETLSEEKPQEHPEDFAISA